MIPSYTDLASHVLRLHKGYLPQIGIDENILLNASCRMVNKLTAHTHIEGLAPLT